MRILFVIDSLGSGGAQRQLATVAPGLVARGHEVHLWAYQPARVLLEPLFVDGGVVIHWTEKRGRFDPEPAVALARVIGRVCPDVVCAFLSTPSVYALLAAAGRVPVVVSERSGYPEGPLRWRTRLGKQIYRLAARIVANSPAHAARLRAEHAHFSDRVASIVNAVDTERFRPPTERRRTRPPVVLAIGRVQPGKRPELLAEAVRILRDTRGSSVAVRWVGRTQPHDEAFHASVDAQLAEAGLTRSWQWLGERDDVPELLREADVLVHPSDFEGLPNAVCEALASGLPVVASDARDHPWLVGAYRGRVFAPRDAAALADALHAVLGCDEAAWADMGRAARAFAESELAVDTAVSRWEALFDEVAHAR